MPLIPQSDIVQNFTGPFSRSTVGQLLNPDLIAVDTPNYMGHLSGASTLAEVLTLVDVLIAGVSNIYLGFSSDGISWHAVEATGDIYVRFAAGMSRPADTDSSWSAGVQYGGLQGAYYIRQYQNAASTPAVPTGGSFDVATKTLTPSTGWTTAVAAPGAGENTYFVEWLFDPSTHTGTIVPTWSAVIEAGGTGPPGTPGVTLTQLFAALLPGDGIAFDDTTPGQRTMSVDATIARLASPVLSGVPTAPTQALGANDLSIANTQWVQSEISGLVDTVAIAGASLEVTDRGGTSRSYVLPSGGGGMAGGTGDLQIDELLNRPTSLPLPVGNLWVSGGLTLTTGVQVLLIDAADATDDYEVVDWDGIKALPAGVVGQVAAAGSYHTFQATIQDVEYEVRIGHDGSDGVLLAANQAGALDLPELRIDRLLAPIEATIVVSDTAFGGIGTTADPLVLDVSGTDFPIISLAKGGLGVTHSDVAGVRTTLGLGSAALGTIGAADGNVPVLSTGGVVASSLLAPGGAATEYLQRTANGQQWAALAAVTDTNDFVDTAALTLNSGDEIVLTLGRTGTLADIVSTPLALPAVTDTNDFVDTAGMAINTNDQLTLTLGRTGTLADIASAALDLPVPVRLGSVVSYDSVNTRINVTVNSLAGGTLDLPPRGLLFFALPTGLPTDSTTFEIAINSQTPRGYFNAAGDLIAGRQITSGRWTSIVRIGDRYYSADNVEAQDAFVDVAYASRRLTFTEAGGGTFGFPLDTSVFHGTAGVVGHTESFISDVTFQFGDYAAAGTRLFIEARTTGGTVGPSTIAASTGFIRLPLLDATNILDNSALSADTPAAGDVLTFDASGNVWAPPSPVGGDGTVTAAGLALVANTLTLSVTSTQGGPFTDTQDLSVITLPAANIASGQFVSDRVGSGPAAGEFLKTDGSASSWLEIMAADVHGGAAAEFLRSNGTVGAWAAISPTDLVAAGGQDGQILGLDSGALAFLSPSGIIGVDSVIAGTGIDVDQGTGNVTVSLESQYQGRQLGISTSPNIQISLNQYLITLAISGVPQTAYGVGDTFTFTVPTPVPNVGTDASPLSLLPGSTGSHFNIVSPRDGSRLTRADLVAGALHTVRYSSAGAFALVEPTGVSIVAGSGLDVATVAGISTVSVESQYLSRHLGIATPTSALVGNNYSIQLDISGLVDELGVPLIFYNIGDTFTFTVPDPITNVGTDASPLVFRPGVVGSNSFAIVSVMDETPLTRAALVAGAVHTVRCVDTFNWALVQPTASSGRRRNEQLRHVCRPVVVHYQPYADAWSSGVRQRRLECIGSAGRRHRPWEPSQLRHPRFRRGRYG